MAERDINSYRFGRNEEPTDEMLRQIMSEVTATAIEKHKKALEKYFANMLEYAEEQKARWAKRFEEASI